MAEIWNWIKYFDTYLFLLINHDADSKNMDVWMVALRNAVTWIPLYFFMVIYIFKMFARKAAWSFCTLSFLAVAIADSVSARLLKPCFGRLRPCYEPALHGIVRVVSGLGGIYSFPSSHASNHFALATFWFYVIWMEKGQKWHWLWVWASIICYAQIYVGNHYPIDILGGAILGWVIGFIFSRIYFKWNFQSLPAIVPNKYLKVTSWFSIAKKVKLPV